jgi:hypothetical protein
MEMRTGAAPDLWAILAVAMVALLTTADIVRRRAGVPEAAPPGRFARILTSVATFAVMASLLFGIFQLLSIGADPQIPAAMAFVGLMLALIALILFGLLDLLLGLLRPKQEPRWLLAALILFPVVMLGSLIGAVLILNPDRLSLGWRMVSPVTAALCAAMAWWSRLPRKEDAVAKLFE